METINSEFQTLFSVAVAGYLLLRMEKRLGDLTDAINNLRHCQTCRLSPLAPAGEELRKNDHS